MTAPIGVAVVGTGAIAATHALAIDRTPGLELVAIGSRSREGAERFIAAGRANWSARDVTAATVDEVLGDARVELVSVVTPTGTHIDIGSRVLAADRHLLLEKPLDVDLRRTIEFARVAELAEQRGLVASAVSQQRFSPAAETVRAALEAGRMGRLTSAVATIPWWRSQAYYDRADWRGTWAQDGGGALMNQGIHTLDLLIWFLGEPVRVSASSRTLAHEAIEVEDTLAAVVEFASGALASVHATTNAFPGLAARAHLMGTSGTAVIEHEGLSYLHLADGRDVGDMGLHGAGNQIVPVDHERNRDATLSADGHGRQFADLAAAIRDGRSPRITIADAVRTLSTIHAIYRSASSGTSVELAELRGQPDFGPYSVGTATSRSYN